MGEALCRAGRRKGRRTAHLLITTTVVVRVIEGVIEATVAAESPIARGRREATAGKPSRKRAASRPE